MRVSAEANKTGSAWALYKAVQRAEMKQSILMNAEWPNRYRVH